MEKAKVTRGVVSRWTKIGTEASTRGKRLMSMLKASVA
jgi:hypothetical protein